MKLLFDENLSPERKNVGAVFYPAVTPKSSPNEGKRQLRPRKIREFKNHANMEDRGNREIREIRETPFLFVYFAYFAVKKVFLGEDLGLLSSLAHYKKSLPAESREGAWHGWGDYSFPAATAFT